MEERTDYIAAASRNAASTWASVKPRAEASGTSVRDVAMRMRSRGAGVSEPGVGRQDYATGSESICWDAGSRHCSVPDSNANETICAVATSARTKSISRPTTAAAAAASRPAALPALRG